MGNAKRVTRAFDSVLVGNINNANNANDAATGSVYGAVAYAYSIAKNETTISQDAEFLNAAAKTDSYGLYSTFMTTSSINGISRSGSSGAFTYSVAADSGNRPIAGSMRRVFATGCRTASRPTRVRHSRRNREPTR